MMFFSSCSRNRGGSGCFWKTKDHPTSDFHCAGNCSDWLSKTRGNGAARFPIAFRRKLAQQLDFILAEAIANAVRHGRASRVDVRVKKSAEYMQLWIRDNGHGVEERNGVYGEAELAAENWGPSSLRSRIAELNGSLVLSSSPEGVELRVD